ncbi:MAG: hypothetical protein CXR30_08580 [Geobacter sp.]|nr:MAG: hypothetical protein CXR30_08580 [Geobacter sp.]
MNNEIKLTQVNGPGPNVKRFTATIPELLFREKLPCIQEIQRNFPQEFKEKFTEWFHQNFTCKLIFDGSKQHFVKLMDVNFLNNKIIATWDWDTNGIFPGHYKVQVNFENIKSETNAGGLLHVFENLKQKNHNEIQSKISELMNLFHEYIKKEDFYNTISVLENRLKDEEEQKLQVLHKDIEKKYVDKETYILLKNEVETLVDKVKNIGRTTELAEAKTV